jgi:hypothetical protein
MDLLTASSRAVAAPLPWIPAVAARWLQELPDPATGLGRLEHLALNAIKAGCETPSTIFAAVAATDMPPHINTMRITVQETKALINEFEKIIKPGPSAMPAKPRSEAR